MFIRKALLAFALMSIMGEPATAQGSADADASDRAAVPAHVQFTGFALPTGVRLDVAQAGPLDGIPVLFLHGYTDSWFSFAPVLQRLPAGVRAIVPTQRGHGTSDRPACCYTLRDLAADAVALLDTLGIERAVIVGHSMGSFVAQRIALDRPDRVRGLMLIGSGTTLNLPPILEFAEYVSTLTDPVPHEFVREFQESTVFHEVSAPFMTGVIQESERLPARVWQAVLRDILSSDAADELHRIARPTLIVWGARDELFSRSVQDELVSAIPDARLVTYEATGHAPHWERPDRFVADLRQFLSVASR